MQEEERSEIARDLHDEIGPSLFAINIDITRITHLLEEQRIAELPLHVRAIADAAQHLQRQVRGMLGRLRTNELAELGLGAAVSGLVDFWRRRYPDIQFRIDVSPACEQLGSPTDMTAYRIVQEGLSNAVRHGRPELIAITIAGGEEVSDGVTVQVADDGRGMPELPTLGYGLTGMAERVRAVGGEVSFSNRSDGGFVVAGEAADAAITAAVIAGVIGDRAMRVLIVDDHPIVRAGLRRLLAAEPQIDILEAANGQEAIASFKEWRPDLVILDLQLPGISGLEVLGRIRTENPRARVLVISMYDNPAYIGRVLQAGARGYVSKNAPPGQILDAVKRVAGGDTYIDHDTAQELALWKLQASSDDPLRQLSPRDLEILRRLADGNSLGEIAGSLGVSYKTVANQCSQLRTKLAAPRMADLIRVAISCGLTRRPGVDLLTAPPPK